MADAALGELQSATDALFPGGKFTYDKALMKKWFDAFTKVEDLKGSMTTEQLDTASSNGERVVNAANTRGGRRRSRRHRRGRSTRRR